MNKLEYIKLFRNAHSKYIQLFKDYYKFFGDVFFIKPNEITGKMSPIRPDHVKNYDNFKKDILTRGMYFPLICLPYQYRDDVTIIYTGDFWIHEGTHRLQVFKDLVNEKKLDADFEVCCFVPIKEMLSDVQVIKPIEIELDDFLRPNDIKFAEHWISDNKFKLYSPTGFRLLLLIYAHAINDVSWLLISKYNHKEIPDKIFNEKGYFSESANAKDLVKKYGKEFERFKKID